MTAQVAALTHPGLKRPINQDAVLTRELAGGALLLALADGAGGMQSGEIASALAVEALADELATGPAVSDAGAALRAGFEAANRSVREEAARRDDGVMASTLVAAIVSGGGAWIAHAGDSRAYLLQDGRLRQLTADHSLVGEQVRAGVITEEEAEHSDYRHVITRGIGVTETVAPDITGPVELPGGVVLILCSDGLYRFVAEDGIATALASPAGDAAERLIDLANEGGGRDNISVVVYRAG